MRMLVVAAVVAVMSGSAFAAELSKVAPVKFETAKCWVCSGGGNNGGTNGGNGVKN